MTASQFAGIFFIIIKIFFIQHPVFIPDQPIALHFSRIKFNLQFYIFRNGKKCAAKFIHQYFFCFTQSINISMIAIAFISQLLHFIVFIISHSISKHGKKHTAFSFFFDQSYHFIITAGAYIKISIRTKDHTVISFFHKIFFCCFISQFNTCATRC